MDTKITLSFDKGVIENAKTFAKQHNISLSRLMEFLLRKINTGNYQTIEDFPVSEWVSQVSEGEVQYISQKRSRKSMKSEFYNSVK